MCLVLYIYIYIYTHIYCLRNIDHTSYIIYHIFMCLCVVSGHSWFTDIDLQYFPLVIPYTIACLKSKKNKCTHWHRCFERRNPESIKTNRFSDPRESGVVKCRR